MLWVGASAGYVARLALAVLVGAAGLAVPAAAETSGLTLSDAVSRALHEGREAKIARLETARADDAVGEARSIYWPHASVESQAGWSNRQNDTLDALDGPPPPLGDGQVKRYPLSTLGSNSAWLSVYVDQTLFDLRQWRGVERVELEAEVAAVAEDEQRDRIAFSVLERYVAVLRLEQLTALDAESVTQAEWLDRQAGLLLASGRVLDAEREQAGLHLEEARLRLENRRAELAEARAALADVIGDDDGSSVDMRLVADSVPTVRPPADDSDEGTLRQVPELRILELRRRMEDLTVSAARAERLPTLSVRGGYFHYGTKRFDSFEDEVAIGVDLKVPVFSGFRTSNAIEGASKAAEAARLRYDAVRDAKRVRVRELARKLTALDRQPALAERRAAIARDRQRLADLSLQAQRGTLPQALATRADLDRDAGAAVEARAERLLVWATLQRETGRLASALVGNAAAHP